MSKFVVGIDPGNSGALVLLSHEKFEFEIMPMKNKEIDFDRVHEILDEWSLWHSIERVYLERAMARRPMGLKHAFNYGRGFAKLEVAVELLKLPVTYIEPTRWTKTMHEGIKSDFSSKEKSQIAVGRLYPKHCKMFTTSKGKLHEGVMDALLIAGFGVRQSLI